MFLLTDSLTADWTAAWERVALSISCRMLIQNETSWLQLVRQTFPQMLRAIQELVKKAR